MGDTVGQMEFLAKGDPNMNRLTRRQREALLDAPPEPFSAASCYAEPLAGQPGCYRAAATPGETIAKGDVLVTTHYGLVRKAHDAELPMAFLVSLGTTRLEKGWPYVEVKAGCA